MKSHAGHNELNALQISTQAEQTIGLKVIRIALKPFERSIVVPAMVAERPGKSIVRVTAPLSGVITSINVVQGEAISAGHALLSVRLSHEELVQAQSDLLRSLAELDVAGRELARLEPLVKDSLIPKKTMLDREYEIQKLDAIVKAQRQALSLHGLTEEQIDAIVVDRELFRELTVTAPTPRAAADEHAGRRLLHVQQLAVELGQHVMAGDLLCVLADHAELYIEGTAFEQDARQIENAVRANAAVTAIVESEANDAQFVPGLHILYVADTVDPQSRAFHFYVRLPNSLAHESGGPTGPRFISWRFKPGQRLKLKVPVETWPKVIVLPAEAVVQEGPESFVFQRFGDHFDRRPVRIEYRDPYAVVVANDGALKLGDMVAASGAEQLQLALKNKSGGPIDPHAGHNH
ncbi:MAG TPA: efflux RND transporter periplasmic adaptor subunit [Pirellulales bacterium]